MIAADTLLLSRMSKMTAIEIFHYAIEMKMSYSCKKWIFEYINRNVMKLPTSYTFEMVLMQPNILSIAQNLHKIYMENISKGVHDLPPIFEINSEVFELTVSVTGEPSIVIHNIHDVIEGADNLVPESCNLFEEIEKKIDELENLENDSLLEQIEEQLDVLGSSGHDPLLEQIGEPDMDPLFEEIEEQLDAIGILGHNALYEQIEDLLDVVGVTDATAGASRSARNLCRNFDFL